MLKSATFVTAIATLMVCTVLYTYTKCVANGHCPALPHLPTISNTWDDPPGNYISRVVLINVACGLAFIQFGLWGEDEPGKKRWRALLAAGVLSTACLSVVGAICDADTDPQCLGDSLIHSICAVVFFVIYDVNCIVLACREEVSIRSLAAPLGSLALKVRWLPLVARALKAAALPPAEASSLAVPLLSPLLSPDDQTPLAVLEWADVGLILGWTCYFLATKRADQVIWMQAKDGPATPPRVIFSLSARALAVATLCLAAANLGVTLALYYLSAGPSAPLPFIGALWVSPPGNWISRWTVVVGSSSAALAQALLGLMDAASLQAVRPHPSATRLTRVSHAIARLHPVVSVGSLLSLDVAGVVSEHEDAPVHAAAACGFFGGYTVFMILRSTLLLQPHAAALRSRRLLSAAQLGLTLAAAVLAGCYLHLPSMPAIEWAYTAVLVAYFAVSIFSHGSDADAARLCIGCTGTDLPLKAAPLKAALAA